MADIFVSYAAEDEARVEPLVQALETAGFTVWWDRQIDAGKSFDRTIEQELFAASCVLVVWSGASVDSDWVREEAEDGLRRGVMVPVQIDECNIPLGFRRVQAAQLIGWPRVQRNLSSLIDQIASLIEKRTLGAPLTKPKSTKSRKGLLAIVLCGSLVLFTVAYFYSGALVSAVILNVPNVFFGEPVDQQLGVTNSRDGTKITFAITGDGPPLVYVLGWMTHLEQGFSSPLYDNERLLAITSKRHRFVRYDGRGFGLSDRDVEDLSLAARVSDLKAVVDAAGFKRFAILAASSGGPIAIAFAAQYPQRVSGLVLASTFASTSWLNDEARDEAERFWDFAEVAWHQPPVSNMFAEMTLEPTGTAVEEAVLGALMRRCCDGPNVAEFFRVNQRLDVRQQAKQIRAPTLVIHARDDRGVALEAGKELVSLIPDSRFLVVEGGHREGSASTAETRRLALDFLASVQ